PAQTVTFAITGGADAAKFSISSGGVLTFNAAPDYEAPTDAGVDNVYNLTVTASDNADGTTTQNIAVTVTNVDEPISNTAPQITAFSSDSECGSLAEGRTANASATFTDPDLGDSFTALINWGDGTTSLGTISRSGANGTVSASHTYGQGGVYSVTLTLNDAASATTFVTTTVMITGVRVADGVLQIVGTDQIDRVNVSRNGHNRYKVVARFGSQHSVGCDDDEDEQEDEWNDDGHDDNEHHGRGGQKFSQTFNATSVQSILVILCCGDDRANIGGSVQIAALLDGGDGDGDDRLNGGSGPNILIGDNGNDRLIGGRGRDILIGGLGCDRMVANGGEDILIAGQTSFDAQHTALSAIMSEWNSNRDFAGRVANIRGTGSGPRLNGSYFLQTGVTVLNDGAADKLTGSAGTDWFFFNTPQDRVTDLKNNEAQN
ncbi:MAG: hypothetical protein IAG10_28545, partial [Planctomycetaceae bacterium]|nr:hypothetical protein [Planctomycetaceae bacterium]